MRGNCVSKAIVPQVAQHPAHSYVNDIFLHALFARITLSNNDTIEFDTTFDETTGTIELCVPTGGLAIFNQITGLQRGTNLRTFINWLIGSQSITAEPALDQDVDFISAGNLTIWAGATPGNLSDKRLVLLLPATDLSALGYNTRADQSFTSGALRVHLVWAYDSGSNNAYDIHTSVEIKTIGSGATASATSTTNIPTSSLITGDVRETTLITTGNIISAGDIVSIIIRRNYNGSPEAKTELVGVVGIRLEFIDA